MKCPNCLSEKPLEVVEVISTYPNNDPDRHRKCRDCGQDVYTEERINFNKTKLKRLQN